MEQKKKTQQTKSPRLTTARLFAAKTPHTDEQ
jgi:hypothetical protein